MTSSQPSNETPGLSTSAAGAQPNPPEQLPTPRWRYVDVLSDFGDTEVFAIDGDCLMFEAISDHRVDWEHGGQFLHVAYRVEQILHSFVSKGATFHVFFVDVNEGLWKGLPGATVARRLMVEHLGRCLPEGTVIRIRDSWWSTSFETFLHTKNPSFIAVVNPSRPDLHRYLADSIIPPEAAKLYELFCLNLCLRGFRVLDMHGLRFKENKVWGFLSEPFGHPKHRKTVVEKAETLGKKRGENMRSGRNRASERDFLRDLGEVCGWRGAAILWGLAVELGDMVSGGNANINSNLRGDLLLWLDLVRVITLHCVLLPSLHTVRERAIHIDEVTIASYHLPQMLDRIYTHILASDWLQGNDPACLLADATSRDLVDFADGRLMTAMCIEIAQSIRRDGTIKIHPTLIADEKVYQSALAIWRRLLAISGLPDSPLDTFHEPNHQPGPSESATTPIIYPIRDPEPIVVTATNSAAYSSQIANQVERISLADQENFNDSTNNDTPFGWDERSHVVGGLLFPIKENRLIDTILKGSAAGFLPEHRDDDIPVLTALREGWRHTDHYHWHSGRSLVPVIMQEVLENMSKDDAFVEQRLAEYEKEMGPHWRAAQLHWTVIADLLAVQGKRIRRGMAKGRTRMDDKFIRNLERYAKSLEGTTALGKKSVVPNSQKEQQKGAKTQKQSGSANRIREQLAKEKADKGQAKAKSEIGTYLQSITPKSLNEIGSREMLIFQGRQLLRKPGIQSDTAVKMELMGGLLRCLMAEWSWNVDWTDHELPPANVFTCATAIDLFELVLSDPKVARNSSGAVDSLVEWLDLIGCKSDGRLLKKEIKALAGDVAKGKGVNSKDVSTDSTQSPTASAQFLRMQLVQFGHLLPRRPLPDHRRTKTESGQESEQPDPRVSFRPDPWQVQLLDAVTSGESALICAPTSSGKTFVSYFCMERVMREDAVGVVVFVAPTKALVNQVAAQVYGNFGNAFGIFTRDYRHNETTCRVLVTVPECLHILLVAPSNRVWASRVRYVILDEVHCISSDDQGRVWEELLLMLHCPMLALSATIGNPEEFHSWLQELKDLQCEQEGGQKKPRHVVRLVQNSDRWADLRKHIILPPIKSLQETCSSSGDQSKTVKGGDKSHVMGFKSCVRVFRLHPLVALRVDQVAAGDVGGVTADMEPADAVELYEVMCAVAKVHHPELAEGLLPLDPAIYFSGTLLVTQRKARDYRTAVLGHLVQCGRTGKTAAVTSVLSKLSHGIPEMAQENRDQWESVGISIARRDFLAHSFRGVVDYLAGANRLPAIVFNFDRSSCVRLAIGLTEDLERKEEEDSRRDWRKEERAASQAAKIARKMEEKKSKNKGKKDGRGEDETEEDGGCMMDRLCDPKFTYADVTKMPPSEFRKMLEETMVPYGDDHPMIRMLIRGIGVHHSGLPYKYRQLVERMFRNGYVRIVLATGTLAYGIHTPCRSVVLAGDSPFLTSLQYRQMSGRAGRRGFDSLGYVFFWGVPMHKIRRLMAAKVPRLVGHPPLRPSTVLQLLQLVGSVPLAANQKNAIRKIAEKESFSLAEGAFQACQRLLSHPLYGRQRGALYRSQMAFQLRFVVDLLARMGLVDGQGHPANLAGLATHLHYCEPGNLLFIWLVRSGAIEEICLSDQSWNEKAEALISLVSQIFSPLPVHSTLATDQENARISPGPIVLPPLSDRVQKEISDYNRLVEGVYESFLRTFVAHHRTNSATDCESRSEAAISDKISDLVDLPGKLCDSGEISVKFPSMDMMPLSGVSWPVGSTNQKTGVGFGKMLEYLVCSPFVAVSGRGDIFPTAEDMCANVHPSIQLDHETLPFAALANQNTPLNAFVVAFYRHGQISSLIKHNGLREGDAWSQVNDFRFILTGITTALVQLSRKESNKEKSDQSDDGETEDYSGVDGEEARHDPVTSCFVKLTSEFTQRLKRFNAKSTV